MAWYCIFPSNPTHWRTRSRLPLHSFSPRIPWHEFHILCITYVGKRFIYTRTYCLFRHPRPQSFKFERIAYRPPTKAARSQLPPSPQNLRGRTPQGCLWWSTDLKDGLRPSPTFITVMSSIVAVAFGCSSNDISYFRRTFIWISMATWSSCGLERRTLGMWLIWGPAIQS